MDSKIIGFRYPKKDLAVKKAKSQNKTLSQVLFEYLDRWLRVK
jgi:hypothetical protein